MIQYRFHAYIDESGNSDLDVSKTGATHYLIIAAVVLNEEVKDSVEGQLDQLAGKFFSGGVIKSSNIGNNDKRRLKILEDVNKLPVRVVAFALDKAYLFSQGFKYKKSFYKFPNKLLYKDLSRLYPDIQIFADPIGSKEFVTEFLNYLDRNFEATLFRPSHCEVRDDKECRLIQLADFFAGTIAKTLERRKENIEGPDYLKVIADSDRLMRLTIWPNPPAEGVDSRIIDDESTFDPLVASLAVKRANEFVRQNVLDDDEKVRNMVETIRYLLLCFQSVDPVSYFHGDEIISHLRELYNVDMNPQTFMTNVIAPLRDQHVFIVAGDKGYKLPAHVEELRLYVNHVHSNIFPRIERLRSYRDEIFAMTNHQVDLFEVDAFEYPGYLLG